MKVAITSTGDTPQSVVDPRFGRAKFILFVDTETLGFEAVDNSANINAFKGAGIQAATMLADKGADVLLTGFCGPNAFRTLDAAGIKVVNDVDGTVADCIQQFKDGKMNYSSAPNADGHW